MNGFKYREYDDVHVETKHCHDMYLIDEIINTCGLKGHIVDVKIETTVTGMVLGGDGNTTFYVTVFYVPFKEVS